MKVVYFCRESLLKFLRTYVRTSRSYIAATTTTTCTKTLVSLKSCRSISEIETLPPTGYFASTVVQSTYVNDDFVSDNEEDSPKIDRNSCCKER